MGKTYIDTVKYVVYANLEIDGLVEKPDVVGAIFGQTEGLLGDELDLRELQKNGRIGRIEVDLQPRGGKSAGKILLPSSLDMVETSILGAALETVDRVGPCDARIKVEKIEDTRNVKRKAVVERAKTLLKTLLTTEIPESREISEMVRQEVKIAEIAEYGPEKLPSGPNIASCEAIIIVEGRADVLNMLKNDITNVIAVGGANVPKTIAAFCREKEVTLFSDGDRGGEIILRELSQVADIDYVARAPPGREVEELSRKEIIKCLRGRVPIEQVDGGNFAGKSASTSEDRSYQRRGTSSRGRDDREREPRRSSMHAERERRDYGQQTAQQASPAPAVVSAPAAPAPVSAPSAPVATEAAPQALTASLAELENTLRARLYDEKLELKSEIPVRDLIKTLTDGESVHAVVFDGIITQRLVDLAESKNVRHLVGVRVGNVFRKPENVSISTKG
ncbi:MAG: DNA primase DnaG [Candidatus Micrarchaeota archaeon]